MVYSNPTARETWEQASDAQRAEGWDARAARLTPPFLTERQRRQA